MKSNLSCKNFPKTNTLQIHWATLRQADKKRAQWYDYLIWILITCQNLNLRFLYLRKLGQSSDKYRYYMITIRYSPLNNYLDLERIWCDRCTLNGYWEAEQLSISATDLHSFQIEALESTGKKINILRCHLVRYTVGSKLQCLWDIDPYMDWRAPGT